MGFVLYNTNDKSGGAIFSNGDNEAEIQWNGFLRTVLCWPLLPLVFPKMEN